MVQLTIRHVPEHVRDTLATRAAQRGQSMQEYLLFELERLASRPPIEDWVKAARMQKSVAGAQLGAQEIIEARDADRR